MVESGGPAATEERVLERLAEMLEEGGADSGTAWIGLNPRERARLAAFRHALPESVNAFIDRVRRTCPEITKVGTDMAVPPESLEEMTGFCHGLLDEAGLKYVAFGHVGDGHLHFNVLPEKPEELAGAKELYRRMARRAVELGGTVSAEHGIGKLKKEFLEIMYGPEGMEEMRRVRRALDSGGLLGPGTLFDM